MALRKPRRSQTSQTKIAPNDRTLRSVHAELLADIGKTDEAVAELKKNMDGSQDHDREVWLGIAQVYEKSRDFDAMTKALDSAEKLATPKTRRDSPSISLRGVMYEREKKTGKAEKRFFRRVLEQDPDNASALNYLGYMLADQDTRLDEAHKLIQKAVDQEPNNGAYLDSLGWVSIG